MKIYHCFLFFLFGSLFLSCEKSPTKEEEAKPAEQITFLPFQKLDLDDLDGFQPVANNWQIVGDVYVDQTQEATFVSSPGTGILLNTPTNENRENLFTAFEHGDIELELDVMMPTRSNSGLYFQGRYEVQLFDSWGVKDPRHSDMGGIYQRWDENREPKGYEGHPPMTNAARAPGLWQHYKIIFHAPRFDEDGNKIRNAWFEEVWLNGELLHKDLEVAGPTRSSAFDDEKPLGPLMIQGDHRAVAIRNIRYKLYENEKVWLSNLKMREFETTYPYIPNYDSLTAEREITTDSISSNMASGERPRKLLVYDGTLNIPESGDYLFEMRVRLGGGLLLVNQDTVADLNGDFRANEPAYSMVSLEKGAVPFTMIYNKHRPFWKGFSLEVEGPGIAKHSLHAPQSFLLNPGGEEIIEIESSNETVIQRSFLMHHGKKRTHCISVATPRGINYSFDLASASLLQAWDGGFLDATDMWHSRGIEQIGIPIGSPIVIHGKPDFAYLESEDNPWPDSIKFNGTYKQLGYELDPEGNPVFAIMVGGSKVTNKMVPNDTARRLHRIISIHAADDIWHKVGEGSQIDKLPGDTYAIDDKKYFVHLKQSENYQIKMRNSAGKEELLVKVPKGVQEINYTLTW